MREKQHSVEILYRKLVDTIPHGIQESDLQGRFTYTNKAYNKIYGYKEDELIGESLFDKTMPEFQRNQSKKYYQNLIEEQPEDPSYTAKGVTSQGELIDVQVDLNYKRDSDGKLTGFISLVTDITEQKRKQRQLEESERTARALLMAPTNSVVLLDRDGIILDLNEVTAKYLKKQRTKLLGMNYFELVPKDIAEQRRAKIDEVIHKGKSVRFEGRFGGVWNDSIAYPVVDAEGNVTKIAFLSHEITERKEWEEELIKAKAKAEEADKVKSEFLANMSHEFRTPMHGILSYSKFGIEKIDTLEKGKIIKYFSQINRSAKRLMNLVNDLLDLGNLETGKKDYSLEEIKLSDLVNAVAREFTFAFLEKNIELSFQKPDFDDAVTVDKNKIILVIRKLLGNAVKFSQQNSNIRIVIEKNKDFFVIAVFDNGIGIPTDEKDKIFEKFIQSSKTKTGAGGTGLGLSICSQIIKAHKGEIWADANPEGGSVFRFTLPLKQTSAC